MNSLTCLADSLVIAGTGHRPNKLGGYGVGVFNKLVELAEIQLEVILKPDLVISGMALGWDQALAEASYTLGIPFIAAVPFEGQESIWPEESQKYYKLLISRAKTVQIVYNNRNEISKAMQLRNQYMVDNCTKLLALWDESKGGTCNCVQYARFKKKSVINVWDSWTTMNKT